MSTELHPIPTFVVEVPTYDKAENVAAVPDLAVDRPVRGLGAREDAMTECTVSRLAAALKSRPSVLIVSASIGAGHDGAAAEISRQATAAGCSVERVDFLDLFPLGIGHLMRTSYRLQLKAAPATWGWLLSRLVSGAGHRWAARLASRLTRKRLLAVSQDRPDLTISTYPLASQALSALRLGGELRTPVVTFLTDMSVHPLWVAPGVDTHLALHDIAGAAARELGARDVRVVGPAVSPRFTPVTPASRQAARERFQLPSDRALCLVAAGSWGVGDIASTVTALLDGGMVTPVVVCGRNMSLLRHFRAMPGVTAFGWVDDMPGLMHACDLVVQNAGGLTSLEARRCGLPVLTYRSLPGHGLTNSRALESAGWARWARDPEELVLAVVEALAGSCPAVPAADIPWSALVGHYALASA